MNHIVAPARVAGLALAASILQAGWAGAGRSITVTTHGPVERCDDVEIRFDEGRLETFREERQIATIPGADLAELSIRVSEASGIVVTGSGGAFEITACVAAGGRRPATAQETLRRISVSHSAGRVSTAGPADADWLVYLLVAAPAGASLDLRAEDGPIELRGLSGRLRVENRNGPISLDDCSGEIDVTNRNGPIDVQGGGGRQRLEAENGPISIVLDAGGWDGDGLQAHADNGPLTIELPEGFASGILVTASRWAPFECTAPACGRARRTWDDEGVLLELGDGPSAVRASTGNGAVTVKRRHGRATLL
jgi:hypothetical protein